MLGSGTCFVVVSFCGKTCLRIKCCKKARTVNTACASGDKAVCFVVYCNDDTREESFSNRGRRIFLREVVLVANSAVLVEFTQLIKQDLLFIPP